MKSVMVIRTYKIFIASFMLFSLSLGYKPCMAMKSNQPSLFGKDLRILPEIYKQLASKLSDRMMKLNISEVKITKTVNNRTYSTIKEISNAFLHYLDVKVDFSIYPKEKPQSMTFLECFKCIRDTLKTSLDKKVFDKEDKIILRGFNPIRIGLNREFGKGPFFVVHDEKKLQLNEVFFLFLDMSVYLARREEIIELGCYPDTAPNAIISTFSNPNDITTYRQEFEAVSNKAFIRKVNALDPEMRNRNKLLTAHELAKRVIDELSPKEPNPEEDDTMVLQ